MNPPSHPPLPIPAHLSKAAREFLTQPPPTQAPSLPEREDTDGWLRLVERTDGYIRAWLADRALPSPVAAQDTQVAGVHTYVLRAEGDTATDKGPIYLDIHGGALLYGGGDLCAHSCAETALNTGMTTWSIDYRMPPLHLYPAALDDCLAVYQALLKVRDPADVFVGGASAGGNLAAALLVRAKDEGLPMPAALVLRTPEVDLTESGDSFHTNAGIDNVLSSLREVNELYANGYDLSHPYLSPLFADLSGFPPTFLQSGTRDLFLSNTVRMHRKLLWAGVEAELHVFEAMPHGGFGGTSPEDAELAAAVRDFLDRHRRRL
ncbi:alpha/beta hydrolase fold domain-containing protein [Streptosporangium sp. LJ11]|uniref:alpha/beta hydrolase n=1 Tax=Streptosporangium sp. LJ11 TaxID=3436927 RepID=UPI003F79FFE1